MPRKAPRLSQSQASASSQNCSQLSQTRLDGHFSASQVNVDDLVTNCVRYFVFNAGQNGYFRRADVQKHCGLKGGQVQNVIDKAASVLHNVYGYKLLVCDQGSTKGYVVTNALPYCNYSVNEEAREVQNILLLLILSHIFMVNGPVSEATLYSFLRNLEIDVNVKHPLFGNVKDYIMHTLIKQKFLMVETDAVSKKTNFSWGVRAEKEISKHKVLKFVCNMYKNCQPQSWNSQYELACEQEGFSEDELNENRMED